MENHIQEPKKEPRKMSIKYLWLFTIATMVIGGLITHYGSREIDRIFFRSESTEMQLTPIKQEISNLSESIRLNSGAILQLSGSLSNSNEEKNGNVSIEISEKVNLILNDIMEIENRIVFLNDTIENKDKKVVEHGERNEENTFSPIEHWLKIGQTLRLDEISTLGIVRNHSTIGNPGGDKIITISLNGEMKKLYPGDRFEYDDIKGNKCYVNYLGLDVDKYGISYYCL